MGEHGLIHEKIDIKILILFVLQRLPEAIGQDRLASLVLCDEGFGYFDFAECLAELVDTGHVEEVERGYIITEKGRRNGSAIESSIPFTVRQTAERETLKLARRMRRYSMIVAEHRSRSDGSLTVSLSLSDGVGEVIELDMLAPSEAEAELMEKNFREKAESIYNRIAEILLEE